MNQKESALQVKPEHYYSLDYDTKGRWISYWHQINAIASYKPESILEIGSGNSVVSEYLLSRGYHVHTLDLDIVLNPDCVGRITNLPLSDSSYDVVACFEVLEHIPFNDFSRALEEIGRISKKHVFISLPDKTRAYRILLQFPKIGIWKKIISIPKIHKMMHQFDGQHFWEIGKKGFDLAVINTLIVKSGFSIIETFRVFENPYHRFYILQIDK